MSQDLFNAPDYFLLDELLTEEDKLIRDAAREWVKREISPIIEDACQKAEFPKHIIPGLAVILIGERADSVAYVNMKHQKCREIGIYSTIYKFKEFITIR